MASVKLIALASTISAILCCLLLMWNESSVTCSITTCKLFETVLLIVALGSYSMYRDISWNNIGKNSDK